ncbi:MarR family EPS-associated transcriptional regulator [candidate division WS5 bacterium]|uniref:MarR family EPS-associated transcriptional regulator n=1 Tax=candidate division WS5 bacterium TaxID=2093353 RepID=A0A419DFG6_9BACT|nr:MAG: MarR family EPS-associated transcriptional regulator [candidate division WS5 bacterium]
MNHTYEQEIRYRLLKVLSQDPQLGQRDMAKKMGISLGKVNYCISQLAAKGLIKITRFRSAKNKIPYTYVLTPKGIEEKGRLTLRFLKRKLSEYEEIKKQIRELHCEVEENAHDSPDSELSTAVKSII